MHAEHTEAAESGHTDHEDPSLMEGEHEFDEWDGEDGEDAPRPIGRGVAFLTSFVGFGMTVAGAALAAAPYYSWQVQSVARQLSGLGIQPGVVVVGGMVMFAVGRIGRAFAKFSGRPAPQTRSHEVIDAVGRMAGHVSHLAGTVANMQEEVRHLALREPVVNVASPAPDNDLLQLYRDQKDAVFRLAASLDKLAKTVTDQVSAKIGTLDDHFESVRRDVADAKTALETAVASVARTVESRPAAVDSVPPATPAQAPAPQAFEPAPAEEVALETPHPEIEPNVSPLSFLDGLKDIAPPSQSPNAPSVEAPPLDFDVLDSTPAALPTNAPPTRQQSPSR